MAKKLLFLMVVPFFVFAGNLTLNSGAIKAHTEVLGILQSIHLQIK